LIIERSEGIGQNSVPAGQQLGHFLEIDPAEGRRRIQNSWIYCCGAPPFLLKVKTRASSPVFPTPITFKSLKKLIRVKKSLQHLLGRRRNKSGKETLNLERRWAEGSVRRSQRSSKKMASASRQKAEAQVQQEKRIVSSV
jgi:hypothetical protein